MENEKLNELLKGVFDSLTDEQKQKAADCKTVEELTACLSKMDVSLPDELLDAAAGGSRFHCQPHFTTQTLYKCSACRWWTESTELRKRNWSCPHCNRYVDISTAEKEEKYVQTW